MDIKDKTVVITGAAQGLGAAIACRLGEQGAKIALVDINKENLTIVENNLNIKGIKCKSYIADVSAEKSVVTVFSQIKNDWNQIDVLVNNAGIIRDQLLCKKDKDGTIKSFDLVHWQSVIDVNLTGVFLCGREASKHMLNENTSGVIINISSITRAGNIGQSNYSAAKSGVSALTVTWAKELAKSGIRVGAIAPGFIETEMTKAIKPDVLLKIRQSVPLNRMGQAEEIAYTVEFIVRNDYFTGRVIEVDGGLRL